MDLPRYLSLLQSNALVFARADLFSDRYEGSAGEAERAAINRKLTENPDEKDMWNDIHEFMKGLRSSTYVSCWHSSKYESAAMWSLYDALGRGVAVVTTYDALTENLETNTNVFCGAVEYIDYQVDVPPLNTVVRYFRKRSSFEHEREVRAVIQEVRDPAGSSSNPAILSIPTKLNSLVDRVCIAPSAPQWFEEVVRDVTQRYGYKFPVERSQLESDPIY